MAERAPQILVAEDEPDLREIMSGLLEGDGFGVTFAVNGREALKLLEGGFIPDCLMVDLMMPEMDGLALIEAVRRDLRFAWIGTVVYTAVGAPNLPEGVVFVQKPAAYDELIAAIRTACAMSESRRPG